MCAFHYKNSDQGRPARDYVCLGEALKDLHPRSVKPRRNGLVHLIAAAMVLTLLAQTLISIQIWKQTSASPSLADLNQMMSDSWKEWDALLTRWLSLNGTLVDLYDYARREAQQPNSNITLSGIGFYLLALANMYDVTSDFYHLSKLRVIVDGLIDNTICYRDVVGFGKIFYVPTYYYNGAEGDSSPIQTVLTAYASVKLWKWTQDSKYRQLAERVATESFSLAAINNATDLAWSQGYYSGRDLTNAKKSVFRQAPITLFYAIYGKEINPTYLTYINRTLNWQFRAQLPSGGLAYPSIGDLTESKAYTGVHILVLTWTYRISPSSFSGYLTKTTNAVSWLQSLPIDFGYMEGYAVTAALINAWKANFTVDTAQVKTATYIGLKVLNFTTYGAFPKASITAYGWRWPELYIGSFFSAFPLPDGQFEPSQSSPLVDSSYYSYYDKNIEYKWETDQGFDRFRANSTFGCGLYEYAPGMPRTLYFLFGASETLVGSTFEKDFYYSVLRHTYVQGTIEQYLYGNGLTISQVSGSATFRIYQEYDKAETPPLLDLTLANGTTLLANSFFNSTINLGNNLMIQQRENPSNFYFVISSNPTWTVSNETGPIKNYMRLMTSLTNGDKILLARLSTTNVTAFDAMDFFQNYTPQFSQPNPLAFDQAIESYVKLKDRIGEHKYGVPSWRHQYQNATQQEVKIIALSFPERTSIVQWNFSQKHLTAIVQDSSSTNSVLKIYSGYKFSPVSVLFNGTTQEWQTVWSFESATRTFTLNMNFSSPIVVIDVFFEQDLTPPSIWALGRPIENPEYNDTVMITADISDPGQPQSGVGRTLLGYWNGIVWQNTTMILNTDSNLYEGVIPPQAYATFVQYRVFTADRAENWNQSDIYSYTVIDTFAPAIRFERPGPGGYVGGEGTITVYCQEANLENMSLYIEGVLAETWTLNGTQEHWGWDTTGFTDGSPHVLILTARDIAGNTANAEATVYTDNTQPIIENVQWDPASPLLGQTVTVKVSASDVTSGIDHIDLLYRDRMSTIMFTTVQMMSDEGAWTTTLNGSQSETTVEFFIQAFDKAGNEAQSKVYSYHVGSFPLTMLLIGIAVGISLTAAFAGVLLFHKKRQGKKPKSTKQPHDSIVRSD